MSYLSHHVQDIFIRKKIYKVATAMKVWTHNMAPLLRRRMRQFFSLREGLDSQHGTPPTET